ncbi:MAG: EamA family transporter [Spirochaetales bacterium]|nr:EamA family transporter [Spirochaetales bacterium]
MKFIIIIASIVLGAVGQFFLKLGADRATGEGMAFFFSLAKNPYTYIGSFCYFFSFFSWMWLLNKFELSYLRPLVGLGYIVTTVLAVFFLQEKITLVRWIGIGLIVVGVYFVSLTAKS